MAELNVVPENSPTVTCAEPKLNRYQEILDSAMETLTKVRTDIVTIERSEKRGGGRFLNKKFNRSSYTINTFIRKKKKKMPCEPNRLKTIVLFLFENNTKI